MAAIHSDEFKPDAVRIALTSILTRRQVASDLGVGHSTLGKWFRMICEEFKVPAQDAELRRENDRLRKENRILREEVEVLKTVAVRSPPVREINSLRERRRSVGQLHQFIKNTSLRLVRVDAAPGRRMRSLRAKSRPRVVVGGCLSWR